MGRGTGKLCRGPQTGQPRTTMRTHRTHIVCSVGGRTQTRPTGSLHPEDTRDQPSERSVRNLDRRSSPSGARRQRSVVGLLGIGYTGRVSLLKLANLNQL